MKSSSPVASSATAVGYQPVGISPRTASLTGASTSTTAMAFCAAFATYSVRPSGLTVTAFGELPNIGQQLPRRVNAHVTSRIRAVTGAKTPALHAGRARRLRLRCDYDLIFEKRQRESLDR